MTDSDEKKKEIEELFLNYAICKKCDRIGDLCNCEIGQPIMWLAQFLRVQKVIKQRHEAEITKLEKEYWTLEKQCRDTIGEDVKIERKLKSRIKQMEEDIKKIRKYFNETTEGNYRTQSNLMMDELEIERGKDDRLRQKEKRRFA